MAEMNSTRSMNSIKRLVSATSRLLVPSQTLPARFAAARQPWQLGQHFSTRSRNLPPAKVASVDDAATSNGDNNNNSRIIETELRTEAEKSYLAYAMSVIVGRALPDVRDGLKPVHRRILYAMHELGMSHNKPFRKCARVVGEVLGKYHPHGDSAVYDALVRLAQDFAMQTPLIDGHGNFGSIDDDPAAAMRYTECRLQAVSSAMLLSDLEADTVDYIPNFDASESEPLVFPARLPNLLINGTTGIAVGIATKIPPHNMGEVAAGLKALIKNPNISIKELMKHIPAPDFPTGAEIIYSDGIQAAYEEGRGSIVVRGKMHIEEGDGTRKSTGKTLIVITELPYQTYKAALVEQIAELVENSVITGISDIRDESDRSGMRVVLEVKRGSPANLVTNQLLKHTALQSRFSCNMVALVDGLPQTLNLKQFLSHFLDFRCSVVERRAKFELEKANKRLHLVDGYLTAMSNVDQVVKTIRAAVDAAKASESLQAQFGLSKEQAEGVLGLTLRRLTSLESDKLTEEQTTLKARIADLESLLKSRERVLTVVEDEASEIVAKFGTKRRTAIVKEGEFRELRPEDVIPNSSSLIVYSRKGFIKRMAVDTFSVQGRGGQGKAGARLKGDDIVEDVLSVNNHDHLLFFSEGGSAYSLRAFQVPEAARTSLGTAMPQILPVTKSNPIAALLPVSSFENEDLHLVMLTNNGLIKRTPLKQFAKINVRGIQAIKIKEEDKLQFVALCTESDSILLTASNGMALHFSASKLRPQGRMAAGVRSMSVPPESGIVSLTVLESGLAQEEDSDAVDDEDGLSDGPPSTTTGPWFLTVTSSGFGKLTPVGDFKIRQSRIGRGLKAIRLNGTDRVVATAVVVDKNDSLLISTKNGAIVRLCLQNVSVYSRTAKGTRVVKLKGDDEVVAATVSPAEELL